jgi:hypothetical protein
VWRETRTGGHGPFYKWVKRSGHENCSKQQEDKLNGSMVMITSVPCRLQSEIHVGGQWIIRDRPTHEDRENEVKARSDQGVHEEPVAKRP